MDRPNKCTRQFGFLLAVAVATATAAQAREIPWRENLAGALKESARTGKPVFADFTASWCGFCKKLDQTTFKDSSVVGLIGGSYIPVKINADANRAAMAQYGVQGLPTAVLLKPNGQMMTKIVGYRDAETYLRELKKLQPQLKEIGALAKKASQKQSLKAADDAFEKGSLGTAYALYEEIAAKDAASEEGTRAKARLLEIQAKGEDGLARAEKAFAAKDYRSAALALKDVAVKYDGTPAAEKAAELKAKMSENAEATAVIRQVIAEEHLASALKDVRDENYGNALPRLRRLVANYGDLPIAAKAKDELARLTADSQVMKKAADEAAEPQSKAWLSLASTWKKNRKPERAKDYLQRVIETFPDSSFAETAKYELSLLR